ncbi:hypothetical protein PAXRUDRAFT_829182 [Paxillus rubicundulus Ve08.2h10]|uniref:Uncharacterized protein n=1 Tax=Paxillus rubicundulus Ve08.2h10 TaxID=930991 RepID=A0A0D0D8B5_9AGAM|nr:hypothetical protein PAXRUDRAFT_829182 [Paxillus rubicundulus Ve08.2h10]
MLIGQNGNRYLHAQRSANSDRTFAKWQYLEVYFRCDTDDRPPVAGYDEYTISLSQSAPPPTPRVESQGEYVRW